MSGCFLLNTVSIIDTLLTCFITHSVNSAWLFLSASWAVHISCIAWTVLSERTGILLHFVKHTDKFSLFMSLCTCFFIFPLLYCFCCCHCCQFDLTKLNTNSTRVDFDRLADFNRLHLIRRINDEAKQSQLISQARHMIQQWWDDDDDGDDVCSVMKSGNCSLYFVQKIGYFYTFK